MIADARTAAVSSEPGYRLFADQVLSLAADTADPRLTAIGRCVVAPLRVAVQGRRGVGRRTVAAALAAAGHALAAPAARPEVVVRVVAEVIKPEDRDAVAAADAPMLVVVNKADLAGRRCDQLAERIGAPTVPMVALLAVAAFDDASWAALQLLAERPADIGDPDAFSAGAHPVPIEMRRHLLETFDIFGVALAVAGVQRGAGRAAVGALLRLSGGADDVDAQLNILAAPARYRRVLDGIAELEALAVTEDRIDAFLRSDDVVLARMAAAADVVDATGQQAEPSDDAPVQLRRALRWQRYSRGPVSAMQRSCGADITRGSLRLWGRLADGAQLNVSDFVEERGD